MTKTPKTLAPSPAVDKDPLPPRGLSRSEKNRFLQVCRMRRDAGRPIANIEADIVVDYLDARARLEELRRVEFEQQGDEHYFLRDRLALAAAIDRAAGVVRKLAHDLHLIG